MDIWKIIKSIGSLADFETWKNSEYTAFKKEVNEKLGSFKTLNDRIEAHDKMLDIRHIQQAVTTQNAAIDKTLSNIVDKFKLFDHNARDFSQFEVIQGQAIGNYYHKDFETYHSKSGTPLYLMDMIDESMKKPIVWIKKECTPMLKEVFENYSEPDRQGFIIDLLIGYFDELKDRFYQDFRERQNIIRDYG